MAAIDMNMKATQQINHGMNLSDWQKLIYLLNSNGKWRQLGVAMEMADDGLDRIATRENPAEALIEDCCRRQRNHTISDVHHFLKKIQFEDGVKLLEKYVEKSDDNEVEMDSSSPVVPQSYNIPPKSIIAYPCPFCSPQVFYERLDLVHSHISSNHSKIQTESRFGSSSASNLSGLPNKDFEIGLKNWHFKTVKENCNK